MIQTARRSADIESRHASRWGKLVLIILRTVRVCGACQLRVAKKWQKLLFTYYYQRH